MNNRQPYLGVSLAPIAGVTDRATRRISRELGCGMTYSELISAKGLQMGGRGSLNMLSHCADEHPMGIQVFGKDAESLGEAAKMATDMGPDEINLNLGCPAKKVVSHGSGVAATKDPVKLARIIRAMRANTDLPLTIKFRTGMNRSELNYLEVGRIAQEEGADAVILHARTRVMGFEGIADWRWIRDLVDALHVPVIGNGDVVDGPSAVRMVRETGCHGVMIARASYGNPWIFREVEAALRNGTVLPPPSYDERVEVLLRHIRYAVEDLGEHRGVLEMRKQTGWYLKGIPGVRELRVVTNRQEKMEDVLDTIRTWRERARQHPKYESDDPGDIAA